MCLRGICVSLAEYVRTQRSAMAADVFGRTMTDTPGSSDEWGPPQVHHTSTAYRAPICVRVASVVRASVVESCTVKHEHESELARVLDVVPPPAYERGVEGERAWWRRALELFGTFRRKQGDVLTREDVAEYRKRKAREELPVTDPERHLGLRVSRLEDMAKGLVVDGDVEVSDLGDYFETKEDEYGAEPNTGYSVHTTSDARNHERPNHLRLFQEGWEPRSFHDRDEDHEHIARVRDMERRNKQATQEFLGRWNEAEKEERAERKRRTGTD
jgi:hypothetical protein